MSDYFEHEAAIGKEIQSITHDGEQMRMLFTDGSHLLLWDGGQDCCEHRYMTCDDDLPSFVGGKLVSIECVDGNYVDDLNDYGDVHEQAFVKVETDTKGGFTIVNHNQHNGYYGGFALRTSYRAW